MHDALTKEDLKKLREELDLLASKIKALEVEMRAPKQDESAEAAENTEA